MKNGGLILWNTIALFRMSRTSWQVGKKPYERRFGEPFEGPVIPFGAMVEYHPVSEKDKSRLHQYGKKVSPGKFLEYVLFTGGIWRRQKSMLEGSMQKR